MQHPALTSIQAVHCYLFQLVQLPALHSHFQSWNFDLICTQLTEKWTTNVLPGERFRVNIHISTLAPGKLEIFKEAKSYRRKAGKYKENNPNKSQNEIVTWQQFKILLLILEFRSEKKRLKVNAFNNVATS